ncbi:MAG: DUF3450 domain-containing protein [Gammaproteobacteria bacterium]|nr:DUF3450 domain-containing protein [Gammaproteobacteria bacterium]
MKQVRGAARLALALALGVGCGLAAAEDAGARYARLVADAESIAAFNALIQRQIGSQESELAQLQAQLATLDTTGAEFGPLLERMFASLEQFVAADVPFVDPVSDRKARIDRLRELMTTEGTAPAERFRRLMEAYQIEMEYGRTMSDYKGTLPDGREAEFVRVGRVSLLYRTVDGSETGYWDAGQKQWVIDNDFSSAVIEALRISRKELAPDLIEVPVPAPQEVRS